MADRNLQLAALFQRMADANELLGGNRFKTNAFTKSARVLHDLPASVADYADAELLAMDGVGKGTLEKIHEFLDTEKIAEHDDLTGQIPAGVFDVLNIQGLGPKTVAVLWRDAGVDSLAALKKAAESGTLAELKGFGKKKIENILKSLAFAEQAGQRKRIGQALPLAQWLVRQLGQVKGVKKVGYAGSLRRGKETIGDVDILVAADAADAPAISDAFAGLPVVDEVIAQGKTKTAIRTTGEAGRMQVDLRIVEPGAFGAALMYFTGSKDHNVRLRERAISQGMSLNEYALTKEDGSVVAAETEHDIYEALGMQWVAPELREDRGEVAAAAASELPELIRREDVRAELHTHTTASDGKWSIRDLALAAAERGFHTVAITDHSKGQVQANGLNEARLEKHIQDIREVAAELKGKITVLAGSEVDILVDGKLDYSDSLLKELDVVVASPHASLAQEPAKATKRFLRAIENPYVTIMGHLTGRLILRREGMSPDLKQLFTAGAERGVAFEINANHYRLDLRDTHARLALDLGCKLAINTDAHGPADLDELQYGVATARRAGATAGDVVNCLDHDALQAWLRSTRP